MSMLNVKNAKRPRTLLNPGPLAFSRPAPAGLVLCSKSAWESLPKGAKAGSAVSRTPWSKSRVQTGSANIQKRAGQSAERNQSSKADMDATARSLDLGVRRLRRARDRAGATFREITKRVRSRIATELLTETSLPISAIGAHVGYANPSAFFARLRPRCWRQRHHVSKRGQKLLKVLHVELTQSLMSALGH
jgi:AraC-like DNA-binding protein